MIEDSYIFRASTDLIAQYMWFPNEVPVPGDATSTPAGRKLFRHPNGQGTVVVYDYWGQTKQLFVPDAKYRLHKKKYDSSPRDHGLHKAKVTSNYFSTASKPDTITAKLSYSRSDAWIQVTYADLRNDGTAKSNTDTLMKFSTTEAAHHCRAVDIPQVGKCDLPNLYQLIILYLESDNIDNLDPTVSSNPDRALGMKNTDGRFNFNRVSRLLASTEFNASDAHDVYCDGSTHQSVQTYPCGVVPVKELEKSTDDAPKGRKIYRHSNNQGSVIEYDYWGAKKKLFVPDAKYRASDKKWDIPAPFEQPNYDGLPKISMEPVFIESKHDEPLTTIHDDNWIQTNCAELKDDGTGKSNTDKLMKSNNTEAAHYCRSVNISQIGQCDLPNLYQLIILFLESDNIDKLDPTVDSNLSKALGYKNPNGRFSMNNNFNAWSSTCNSDVMTAYLISYLGYVGSSTGDNDYVIHPQGVIPVKDID